ncbi:MAG: hypothetical protein HKN30_17185 [Sulfitobacter sp.]|nr:hypothetical protein [Sulfitobacter sp.]
MKKATLRRQPVEALTLKALCRFCEADESWVIELVEHGVLKPRGSSAENWQFAGTTISRAKKARRLNRDHGINTPGVAMVLDLLEERERILRRLARTDVY